MQRGLGLVLAVEGASRRTCSSSRLDRGGEYIAARGDGSAGRRRFCAVDDWMGARGSEVWRCGQFVALQGLLGG
jgi:hypothetical protein